MKLFKTHIINVKLSYTTENYINSQGVATNSFIMRVGGNQTIGEVNKCATEISGYAIQIFTIIISSISNLNQCMSFSKQLNISSLDFHLCGVWVPTKLKATYNIYQLIVLV